MSKKKITWLTISFFCIFLANISFGLVKADKNEDMSIRKTFQARRSLSENYVPGEIIVRFKPETKKDSVDKLSKSMGASIKRKLRLRNRNVYVLKTPNHISEEEIIKKISKNPNVIYAERNAYKYAVGQLLPNDANFPEQWALHNTGQMYPWDGRFAEPPGTEDCDIDAPEGWYDVNDATGMIGNPNIVIAILDTGIDYNHSELDDAIGTGDFRGYDFINDDNDPMDDNGHGTHCAGIAAAEINNDNYISGVAGGCTIMAIKVLDDEGIGNDAVVVEGIDYAADPDHKANVISMSLAGEAPTQFLRESIQEAYDSGCVIVAAAGNSYSTIPQYPASYPVVISVSATDSDDQIAVFSSIGRNIDVSAPGVDVLSLHAAGTDFYGDGEHYYPDGDPNAAMYISCGTSMSCPHVAGLAGLCLSIDANLTPEEVTYLIRNGADDLGTKGWDYYYGAGRINVKGTVSGVINGLSKATNPFPEDDANNISVNVDLSWKPSAAAMSHDVYFGTDFDDVNDANHSSQEFKGNQIDNRFELGTLDTNSTYYWRIDEVKGANTVKGDIWNFTTGSTRGIIYVDCNADPNGDGTSWATAFNDLQDALEDAVWGGDEEIWVARGTYKPTDGNDRSATFQFKDGLRVYGGFDGTETSRSQRDWTINETILSGDINEPNDINDNSYHIVTGAMDSSTIIDGFIITKGYFNEDLYHSGSGMYNEGDTQIRNCVFIENTGDSAEFFLGVALYNTASYSTISNCSFIRNGNGGLYNYLSSVTVEDGIFNENTAPDGAGIFSISYEDSTIIRNCIFTKNLATYDNIYAFGGGAICIAAEKSPKITNCTFSDNESKHLGGGFSLWYFFTCEVSNCIFWENTVPDNNGAEVYIGGNGPFFIWGGNYPESIADFAYCDIQGGINGSKWGGYDANDGGGNIDSNPIFANFYDFSDVTVANGTTTTIEVNDASLYEVNDVIEYNDDGVARTVTNVNTIVDVITFYYDPLSSSSVSGVRIYNWGPGATDLDEDYHLDEDSPCIDSGDPNGDYVGQLDIDGDVRSVDCDYDGLIEVDMGADEVIYSPPIWNYLTQCYGDCSSSSGIPDGRVNIYDLAVYNAYKNTEYGDGNYNPAPDFDRDGDVDNDDYSILNANYGQWVSSDCEAGGTWPPAE